MKNKDLFTFKQGLDEAEKFMGVKFAYAVAKNSKLVTEEIEALQKTITPTKKYQEFENKRNNLIKEYAEKDENGNPKEKIQDVNGQEYRYYTVENIPAYNEKVKELSKEYEEEIQKREDQMKDHEKILNEDCTLKFHKIILDNIPEDITGEILKKIDWMLEE